ncbi:leucine-rich repeat extensin-like protein 7 [Iris pallida]|uniref:Leucine-rich repeat extensin-like protein 7 n=1 Tax=Iris pallida TaxID=29817 RepID=A0AAX6GJ43_IRIPA|nr:leucine-rich repeat extensin-like protein 7 [Iris pallida]
MGQVGVGKGKPPKKYKYMERVVKIGYMELNELRCHKVEIKELHGK